VRGNNIHHSGRIGITGGPVGGIRINGNEMAFNNTGSNASGHQSGTKIIGASVGSSNLVFRGNTVHDNTGVGLWVDTNVPNVTFRRNTVENHSSIGIFYETSSTRPSGTTRSGTMTRWTPTAHAMWSRSKRTAASGMIIRAACATSRRNVS
jgi:hypothetical protein